MSKTRDNVLTKTYSGKFGDQVVFRVCEEGESVMAKPPKRTKLPPNAAQIAFRRKFRTATKWAKVALQDPQMLPIYEAMAKGRKTPYILAVRNYLCPPDLALIDKSKYTGAIGSKINVTAYDDFKIKSVTVTITDATGTLIEQGVCQEDLSETDTWGYTATVAVADLTGVVITAEATDYPNHTDSKSLTL